MTFNFNNIIDAYGGNTPLIKIYGSNDYLLWQKYKPTPEVPAVPVFSCNNNIVTITCSTPNAAIWYRNVDSSSGDWIEYTGPFEINDTTTFIAFASKNGVDGDDSEPFTAVYNPTIIITDDPVITCVNNVVTISCSTSGATIYYRIGSSGSYTIYSNSFSIQNTVTVYSYATKSGWTDSEIINKECEYIAPVDNNYLTFNIISGGNIRFNDSGENVRKTISYRKNNGEWINITSSVWGINSIISVNAGDILEFKGDNSTYQQTGFLQYSWDSPCIFTISGNIMSLIDSVNYQSLYTLTEDQVFRSFFNSCIGITSIEHLILPASELTYDCYGALFAGCTGLTTISSGLLPATTLARQCYQYMFEGCTGLTSIPSGLLPATTLADGCYMGMFKDCTSLTTIPSGLLPATTLTDSCYEWMFYGCTALTTVASDLLLATILANSCYAFMFSKCTSLTNAPELPATTLVQYCYSEMFRYCSNLNYIKCLATNIRAEYYTDHWVENVSSTGTFIKAAGVTWPSGSSGIPSGWKVQEVA